LRLPSEKPHHQSVTPPAFQAFYSSAPVLICSCAGLALAVTDAYLHATMTRRERYLGRGVFDVFRTTNDPSATGSATFAPPPARAPRQNFPRHGRAEYTSASRNRKAEGSRRDIGAGQFPRLGPDGKASHSSIASKTSRNSLPQTQDSRRKKLRKKLRTTRANGSGSLPARGRGQEATAAWRRQSGTPPRQGKPRGRCKTKFFPP